MKITSVVSELEMDMEESQNSRDKRVEELWKKLDPQGTRELDLKGLQKGLRKIDHPMKNADDMLQQIIKMVDTSGDGKIQYEEFRVFVEAAERQLLLLFRSIDKDRDGKLNKDELRAAFQKSGLAVPLRRLNGFFDEIDMNHDGYISFDEWRDFLLFMPTGDNGSHLEAALSYYSSIVVMTAEGDSVVSEETLEGLGTTGFLLQALFGSLLKLAQPSLPEQSSYIPPSAVKFPDATSATPVAIDSPQPQPSSSQSSSPPLAEFDGADAQITADSRTTAKTTLAYPHSASNMATIAAAQQGVEGMRVQLGGEQPHSGHHSYSSPIQFRKARTVKKTKLTQYLPEPGYFVAGALAGGVSRTATAPLDRLKVYLLVNTNATNLSLEAAKQGQPLAALRRAGRPIGEAIAGLYKAGGLRTFFAGNGLNVVKIMPETAIKFGSYEAAKRTLASLEGHGDPSRINTYSKFIAGGLAGMIAQFFVYPLDTLKFRLQCETVQGGPTGNALIMQTAKRMWASGGTRAAYRGVTMGLVGMFPYSAIDMGTFELLKSTYKKYKARYSGIHEEDAAPGNVITGIIGASSGAFGATMVYPLNVLRTRLQTQGTVMHPPTYTGIWDVAQKTIRNEGVRGLYKGLTPNLLKVAPALSITWVVYENSKKMLNLH